MRAERAEPGGAPAGAGAAGAALTLSALVGVIGAPDALAPWVPLSAHELTWGMGALALWQWVCALAMLAPPARRVARWGLSLGWAAALAASAPALAQRPLWTLALGLIVGAGLTWIWGWTRPEADLARSSPAMGALLVGLPGALALPYAELPTWALVATLGLGLGTPTGLSAWRQWRAGRSAIAAAMVLGAALVVAATAWWPGWAGAAAAAAALGAGAVEVWGLREHERARLIGHQLSALIFGEPARAMVLTFGLAGLVGGVLLALPAASTGSAHGLLDALFTSFSAVCVTGLIVLDTPHDFTFLGQLIILALIQIGGLGIMTFSTAGFALLGQRLSIRQEIVTAELLGEAYHGRLTQALRNVLWVTSLAEGLGALALTLRFWSRGEELGGALWRGVFTATSAFCNAGFALQSDSLIPYQGDPMVLGVVGAMIVVGGLGPVTALALPAWARGERPTPQARLVLLATGVLLAVPALLFVALEWSGGLAGMAWWERLLNGAFQSVTLRTAGFNSIELGGLRPATLMVMMIAMFIGGSPGSTAGGIKTTTAALLALLVRGAVRGEKRTVFAGHTIAPRSIYRAAAVGTLGLVSVLGLLWTMQLTQEMSLQVMIFEVVSALATVGLSIGGTAQLDAVGQVLIIAGMFMGRVGPLTLFLFVAGRDRAGPREELPQTEISVG